MLPNLDLHHVGIGTTDLEAAIATYAELGIALHMRIDDPNLGVRLAFLGTARPWIELVAPLDDAGGPLKALLSRGHVPGPYHTCYAVDDLLVASAKLVAQGFVALGKPKPALAFGNAPILFHSHRLLGLVELAERPPF
ncbi:MAG TPA: VOC family protein [Polyangiaceae bacterium]|jgi:methylmalonyl-CoA/ethylmalonyl-CoA epimerase|nr:VOC family protein [Polyangiaceae bacterium]